jgi:steroid 5-alpha reductase family enzyme
VIAAFALAGCLVALWLVSLRQRDSSLIDLFWGPAFGVIAWLTGPSHPRGFLVAGLVTAWGLRLGLYLAWRNLGHGEDKRYTAMRQKHGAHWWWRSLFIVFGLQGVLAWVVSWPVRSALLAPFEGWRPSDAMGTALVLIGVAFESLGDWQLARFKANPANRGRIMDQGLWRYTRHPNYFGDFVVWWGLGVIGWDPLALVGPLVMSVLLIRVSGKALLEQGMKDRPGFAEYAARTSGFFPWWPRGR